MVETCLGPTTQNVVGANVNGHPLLQGVYFSVERFIVCNRLVGIVGFPVGTVSILWRRIHHCLRC